MPDAINYIKGDITKPQIKEDIIILIPHVVNDIGLMGSGVARALFMKWPDVRKDYIAWYNFWKHNKIEGPDTFRIGKCQLVETDSNNIFVVNMVGQNGIVGPDNPSPINYEAIDSCLKEVERLATEIGSHFDKDVEVHMPRIGCGLAQGKWERIEPLILKNIKHPVLVYDWN